MTAQPETPRELAARGRHRTRAATNLFIVIYLGVQLTVPLRGFVDDRFGSRGNFSWNMYSGRYECRVEYLLLPVDGDPREIDFRSHFKRESRAMMTFHRDTLARFHAFLCREYRDELGSLRGKAACRLNGGARVDLVVREVDLCTAENHGVIAP